MSIRKQGLVFISCGQYRQEEIRLGKALAQAVNELTPFEGYFAENQSSLEGLSQNILGALNGCVAKRFCGKAEPLGKLAGIHYFSLVGGICG